MPFEVMTRNNASNSDIGYLVPVPDRQAGLLTVDASSSPMNKPSFILIAPIMSYSSMCAGIGMPGGPPTAICY